MEMRIASPEFNKNDDAKELYRHMLQASVELNLDSPTFYYDFPLFRDDTNQLFRSKAVLASKSHGLILIGIVDDPSDDGSFTKSDKETSQIDAILYGKFLRSNILRRSKRALTFSISAIIYSPEADTDLSATHLENPTATTFIQLRNFIGENKSETSLNDEQWEEITSLLEGAKGLSRTETRDISNLKPDSKAFFLHKLEQKIKNFDREQRRAAISVVDGPQRIRGIAGSGKTIVLAMKAAHLHLANPDALILFTFWTKALYDLIQVQITRFYRQFADTDPDWDKLHILHAWGGRNIEGVYYNTCVDNGKRPIPFQEAQAKNRFDYVCKDLLNLKNIDKKYDHILIDEGQDLPTSFYNLCFEICNGGEVDKNIIWAYDELQTIMEAQTQDVTKTFGSLPDGTPRMDLERAQKDISNDLIPHDIILKKSYRNPPQVLMCAHALGLGIYSTTPVQMLENSEHWEDLGYKVVKGTCTPGESTTINRPEENSPLDLAQYVDSREIIECESFENFKDEIDWVFSDICHFLDEGLKPHDIMVISIDDRNAKSYFSSLSQRLATRDILVNNVHQASYTAPKFHIENHLTLSTIYKAKGNEAAVVYIVGADAIEPYLNMVRARNKLFTAFTRSRAWVRLSGMGIQILASEIEESLNNFPNFEFIYPDPEEIYKIQRDISERTAKLSKLQQLMLDLEITDVSEEELSKVIQIGKAKTEK